jgi:hypothetical protein
MRHRRRTLAPPLIRSLTLYPIELDAARDECYSVAMSKSAGILLYLLAFTTAAISGDSPAKWSTTVLVSVADRSAERSEGALELRSSVNAALRGLGDIAVVETNEAVCLDVLIAHLSPAKTGTHGYVISVAAVDWSGALLGHTMLTAPDDGLRDAGNRIVAQVDTQMFEPLRLAYTNSIHR